jgi:hypothetical protein
MSTGEEMTDRSLTQERKQQTGSGHGIENKRQVMGTGEKTTDY